MLRASLGKVVHTVKRAGTYAAKVSHKELHKIAVHVRAVVFTLVLCSLVTALSCIDPSVKIVTKSPKLGPLLIFFISVLDANKKILRSSHYVRSKNNLFLRIHKKYNTCDMKIMYNKRSNFYIIY